MGVPTTDTLRCVVVDDEPLARQGLREMLAEHPDVEVVAECADGRSGLRAVREHEPDVLFLDVHMPGMDGLALARALDGDRAPEVVFVSAHDRYAIHAFEVEAADYILKPFDGERLADALDRARSRRGRPLGAPEVARVLDLLEAIGGRRTYPSRLPVRQSDRMFLQPVDEIDWVEADGKRILLHVRDRTYPIREPLTTMARRLDPRRFVRVSRSAIVNVDRIREIQPWFNGDHMIVLEGGGQVATTRSYRGALSRLLSGT